MRAWYGTFREGSATLSTGPWGPFTGSTSRDTLPLGESLEVIQHQYSIYQFSVCYWLHQHSVKQSISIFTVLTSSVVIVYYNSWDMSVSVPVCVRPASSRGQQQLSVTRLTCRALCTSQQWHHYLTHVSIEDVTFIGSLGKVKSYRTSTLWIRNTFRI